MDDAGIGCGDPMSFFDVVSLFRGHTVACVLVTNSLEGRDARRVQSAASMLAYIRVKILSCTS
jgi:hypothetical protein